MGPQRQDGKERDDLPKTPITLGGLREAWLLARYLLPYRFKLLAGVSALCFGSATGLALPYVAGALVDGALLARGDGPVPWQSNVDLIGLSLLGMLALQALSAFLRSCWFVEVGERSLADLRRDTYARLVRLSMAFHNQRRIGELSSRLASDLTQIHSTVVETIPRFLRQSAILVGEALLIAVTSPRLAAVMLATLPAPVVLALLFGNRIRSLARHVQDHLAESNVIVQEVLQNIASVKAFNNEAYEESRYRSVLDRFLVVALRAAKFEGAFVAAIAFALYVALALVVWYGARLVLAGDLSAGQLTRFLFYTLFVSGAVSTFAELYRQVQRSLGATHRVREILGCTSCEPHEGASAGPRLQGDLAFEDVRFRYPSRPEVEVLRGVSLAARAGQRIALVGPSGAGKSTLVNLLLRFYDPEGGRIVFDGRAASSYDLHQLRGQLAVVPQEVMLFGGSIAENIAYGRAGATQEEIEAAAAQANAHDFIVALPQGYQTRVGERGMQLSGGQRQRVAIARAILRNPAILLLDEATSSLDSESEDLVMQALERLMEGRTALIIAHRLSTVRSADRIYVLKDGRTVEAGTHAELLARPGGAYRNLSQLQPDPPAEGRPQKESA